MSAAGGRLAHLPEPRAEPLETDLGTVIKTQLFLLYFSASSILYEYEY